MEDMSVLKFEPFNLYESTVELYGNEWMYLML